ncbi:MAG: SUMF1/EgtB/PvdO family nonheme iron enzyme [Candidatus Poribacteria bacterium]|nr:SUMF1/EgtB/PvdO family nonheme iron enzyme [Candidatus Poribacteria bacterium]
MFLRLLLLSFVAHLVLLFGCDQSRMPITDIMTDTRRIQSEDETGAEPEPIVDANMVLIPAGEVSIGLSQSQLERYKQQYPPTIPVTLEWFTVQRKAHLPATALPLQTVYVDAFYMDIHEVTWEQYLDFVNASGYESTRVTQTLKIFPDLVSRSGYFGKKPITQLTIPEMKAYAEWHGKHIPTEIEWEKAARGGLRDKNYPWGNEIDPTHANYNHAGILNVFNPDNNTPVLSLVEVGQYPANGYGLYDMAGNVSEFVTTQWDHVRGDIDDVISRGGNYRRPGFEQQNWYRNYHKTGEYTSSVGFRCVKRINVQPRAQNVP